MAKEWILNSSMNRYGLNKKASVGPTSESIRACAPRSLDEWSAYYFSNVKPREHIEELGRKLYVKITEVIQAEVASVTEQDCVDYMFHLVIDRTYQGYVTEKTTIYGQLQDELGVPIEPASDEWDRRYNVDFFIKIGERYIGLQIKPVSVGFHIPTFFMQRGQQAATHEAFTKKFGGKVFYVFSTKTGDKKAIVNMEVVEEIRAEIARLEALE